MKTPQPCIEERNRPDSLKPTEVTEIVEIRDLMTRLVAANDEYRTSTLRLLVLPGPDDLAAVLS